MSGDNLGSFDFPDFLNDNDTEIDRMIEERAGAHNLTGTNIRNILYHVVQLGVKSLNSDIWDDDEELLSLPEPKTRAAKQKLHGGTNHVPLLTLPEVKSPDHEEEDDCEYQPTDTEESEDSDDDLDSLQPATPLASKMRSVTPCTPNTPSEGLVAKRTRSNYSLKEREIVDLELLAAPDEESVSALDFSQVEDDDNMFGLFLRGIHNPRVEFPEEECPQEELYCYRHETEDEEEEFRTDKAVKVTKREMNELLKELDDLIPGTSEEYRSKSKKKEQKPPQAESEQNAPLFTESMLTVLKQQLQLHLQLLVQHCILSDGVPELEKPNAVTRSLVEELEEISSSNSTDTLLLSLEQGAPCSSVVSCLEIYPAIRLINGERPTEDARPVFDIPQKISQDHPLHMTPIPPAKWALLNNQPFFHRFLNIRPTIDFINFKHVKAKPCTRFTDIEDNLVAHGMDAFKSIKDIVKQRNQALVNLIHEYFVPVKKPKQIAIRIKNKSAKNVQDNVIKTWKTTGKIEYDTKNIQKMFCNRITIPLIANRELKIAPAVNVKTHAWLKSLKEQRKRLRREFNNPTNKRVRNRPLYEVNAESMSAAYPLMSLDKAHNFEIAFFLKAKEVLKNDTETYFNVFKCLAEYRGVALFDCEEVIRKVIKILEAYPELCFEFLAIFSPLPDMPVDHFLEILNYIRTRILLKNLEQQFSNNPIMYKKVINLVTGSNSCDPAMTRDALLAMLKGKKELSDQVLQYFDKSSVKPAPHEYEFIDLTCTEEGMGDRGDFEEISLLDRKSHTESKHNDLVDSINEHHDKLRRDEEEQRVVKKQEEEEAKRRRKAESSSNKRRLSAMNTIECDGNEVVLWTVEQDREILQYCKTAGARSKTFRALSKSFVDKTEKEVHDRYNTLLELIKRKSKAEARRINKAKQVKAKGEKVDKSNKGDKSDKSDKGDKSDKSDTSDKGDKGDKSDKSNGAKAKSRSKTRTIAPKSDIAARPNTGEVTNPMPP